MAEFTVVNFDPDNTEMFLVRSHPSVVVYPLNKALAVHRPLNDPSRRTWNDDDRRNGWSSYDWSKIPGNTTRQ